MGMAGRLFALPAGEMRLGKADGSYQLPFPGTPRILDASDDAAIFDANRDGILDLIIEQDSNFATLIGNGDGTFRMTHQVQHGAFFQASTIQPADFNGDGLIDFVARFSVEQFVEVYLNDPLHPGDFQKGQRFTMEAGGSLARGYGGALTVGDFNQDTIEDLVLVDKRVSDGNLNHWYFYSGQGDGTFVQSLSLPLFKENFFHRLYPTF